MNQSNLIVSSNKLLLSSASRETFRSTLKPTLIKDGKKTVAEIARVGKFEGHPDGDFELTRKMFDQAIRNFEEQKNPVPVYRGHSDLSNTPLGEEARAAGWILGLQREGDKLKALIELTDELAEQIDKGEFRFTSIHLMPKAKHRVTGKNIGARLVSLAITNQPFLDGMQPLSLALSEHNIKTNEASIYVAKDIVDMTNNVKETSEKILSELKLKMDEDKLKAVQELVSELLKSSSDQAASEDISAQEDGEESEGSEDMSLLEGLAQELETDPESVRQLMESNREQILEMLKSAMEREEMNAKAEESAEKTNSVGSAVEQPTATKVVNSESERNSDSESNGSTKALSLVQSQLEKAEKRIQELEDEKSAREKAENIALVDKAIRERKIDSSERDDYLEIMEENKELALRMLNKRKGISLGKLPEPTEEDSKRNSLEEIESLNDWEKNLLQNAGVKVS